MDYQIEASARRCVRTGRELKAGEKFFSVLYDRGAALAREDICQEAWQGPPADAFSFWMSKVPPQSAQLKPKYDDDLLFDCFERLAGEAESAKVNFRYILALLLMRRRRLKFEEAKPRGGAEVLYLRCTRTKQLYEILNPQLTETQIAEVQEEVRKVLGVG